MQLLFSKVGSVTTDASPLSFLSWAFIAGNEAIMVWNIPLVVSCQLSCLCPLPAYSSYSLWGEGEESLDTVQALFQQQPKPWCVIRTALVTNPKHSIILTAVNKVHPIQYKLHTSFQIICIIPLQADVLAPAPVG